MSSISSICTKCVKIRLVAICHFAYLLQLVESTCSKAVNNKFWQSHATSMLTTWNKLVVNKLSQAIRTHSDISLFIISLLKDVNKRVATCAFLDAHGMIVYEHSRSTFSFKVIDSGWSPSNIITLYPGKLVDLTEVKCSLPESPVNIGDYGNEGVTAAGLKIALSNNRINVSKDSVLFITYDSVCQECNTTFGCRLRVGV